MIKCEITNGELTQIRVRTNHALRVISKSGADIGAEIDSLINDITEQYSITDGNVGQVVDTMHESFGRYHRFR